MDVQQLYDLIEAHLENEIPGPTDKMGKLKRMKLPIPKEYGGGYATGYGYEETILNMIDRIRDQIKMESKAPFFSESWEAWIRIKEGQEKAPSTISNYKYVYRVHLEPAFGKKRIDLITPDDIQDYFNSIIGKSRSLSNQSKAILKGVFDRAVRMGHVNRNIMLYQYDISKKTGKKEVLQDKDLINVISRLDSLRGLEDGRDYLYLCFLCFTALRRGEILGLRWKDIDFVSSEIHVCNNVTFPNGQNNPIVCKPKDGSIGVVHLNSELKKRIEPLKAKGYVIPYSFKEADKPMTKSMFSKMWKRIEKAVDLKGATSHSFRASYATMMNAHCNHIDPKALQGALRHKTPDLAIKVYTKENVNKTRIAEEEYDEWLRNEIAK